MSAVGKKQLMLMVERSALIMNCANSFPRDNKSWLLERFLRDQEVQYEQDRAGVSMRIDIFEPTPVRKDEQPSPVPDHV